MALPPEDQAAAKAAAAPTMADLLRNERAAPTVETPLSKAQKEYDIAKKEWEAITKVLKVGPAQDSALGRMKFAKAALDKAQADFDANASKQYQPNSFDRHYEAIGEAQGKGATPEMLGARPQAIPARESVKSGGVKAGEVAEKLKAEDAKDGANFWDIIEAASAGWGGRKSAYAEKKQREKEAQTEMDRLIKATELQAAAGATQDARQFSNQIKAMEKNAELEKASKLGVSALPGLGGKFLGGS
jgi:hypothetical protein